MKKIILLSLTLVLLLACETGVKNHGKTNKPVLSETKKSYKGSSTKIFSKSYQPGYYLQMAVFAKNKPSKAFLKPLDKSSFQYIVLNKNNKHHVLIGAYKSYNAAKSKVLSVKSSLKKHTFVVQVLRP
jgi:hypothetical protein